MTTCTLQLIGLPRGRKQIDAIRYYRIPPDAEHLNIGWPSFATGLEEISAFHRWAKEAGLKVDAPNHVAYAVACKQKQLLAFWHQNYAPVLIRAAGYLASGEKVLRETNERTIGEVMSLRKAIEQLSSRKFYALIAYEY